MIKQFLAVNLGMAMAFAASANAADLSSPHVKMMYEAFRGGSQVSTLTQGDHSLVCLFVSSIPTEPSSSPTREKLRLEYNPFQSYFTASFAGGVEVEIHEPNEQGISVGTHRNAASPHLITFKSSAVGDELFLELAVPMQVARETFGNLPNFVTSLTHDGMIAMSYGKCVPEFKTKAPIAEVQSSWLVSYLGKLVQSPPAQTVAMEIVSDGVSGLVDTHEEHTGDKAQELVAPVAPPAQVQQIAVQQGSPEELNSFGETWAAELNWVKGFASQHLEDSVELMSVFNETAILYTDITDLRKLRNHFSAAQDLFPRERNAYGLMLRDSLGGPADPAEAENQFRLAAEQEYPHAQAKYATILYDKKEMAQAREFFRKAAEGKVISAYFDYGWMLRYAEGGPANAALAREYLGRAAKKNHGLALREMGDMLVAGIGGDVDFDLGLRYLKRASEAQVDEAEALYRKAAGQSRKRTLPRDRRTSSVASMESALDHARHPAAADAPMQAEEEPKTKAKRARIYQPTIAAPTSSSNVNLNVLADAALALKALEPTAELPASPRESDGFISPVLGRKQTTDMAIDLSPLKAVGQEAPKETYSSNPLVALGQQLDRKYPNLSTIKVPYFSEAENEALQASLRSALELEGSELIFKEIGTRNLTFLEYTLATLDKGLFEVLTSLLNKSPELQRKLLSWKNEVNDTALHLAFRTLKRLGPNTHGRNFLVNRVIDLVRPISALGTPLFSENDKRETPLLLFCQFQVISETMFVLSDAFAAIRKAQRDSKPILVRGAGYVRALAQGRQNLIEKLREPRNATVQDKKWIADFEGAIERLGRIQNDRAAVQSAWKGLWNEGHLEEFRKLRASIMEASVSELNSWDVAFRRTLDRWGNL